MFIGSPIGSSVVATQSLPSGTGSNRPYEFPCSAAWSGAFGPFNHDWKRLEPILIGKAASFRPQRKQRPQDPANASRDKGLSRLATLCALR